MDIEIYKATPEDIEIACRIAIEVWTPIRAVFRKELGDELYEAYYTGWEESKRNGVSRAIMENRCFVSKINGTVAGFISYAIQGDKGTIGLNAVDPQYRGNGIGVKQYEFIMERMRQEGAKYVCVHTGGDDGHAPARRAYEKAGFEAFLPTRTYYKKL